jgi:hypothetical protein
MKFQLKSDIERAIYAAAFVYEYNRLNTKGYPHDSWREEVTDVGERIRMWEEFCTVIAKDNACSLLELHRWYK